MISLNFDMDMEQMDPSLKKSNNLVPFNFESEQLMTINHGV